MKAVGGRPPSRGLLSLIHAATAAAHVQAGDLDAAAAVLDEALAHPIGGRVADEVRVPGIAAFVAAATGELSRADRARRHAPSAADELGLGDHEPGRIFAGLATAEVHLERHDHEAAARMLDERHAGRRGEPAGRRCRVS